ncbi:MAG: ABC transporter permease [Ruminococcaceae bacterium]|nr:ABC transporter permease [Oscillospiraceae bacterium]
MELFFGIIIVGVIAGIVGIIQTKNKNKLNIVHANINNCKLKDTTLTVKERNPQFKNVFDTKQHKISSYKYNKEELHVGAVTVGGVTTGGVYKTGGDYTVRSSASSRFKLIYKTVKDGKFIIENEIKEIRLSPELAKAASDSYIKNYLDGNKIIVVQEIPPSQEFVSLMSMGQTGAALTLREKEEAAGYPTEEDCLRIVSWLSGRESMDEVYAEIAAQQEENAKKFKKNLLITIIVAAVIGITVASVFGGIYLHKNSLYNDAAQLVTEHKYDEARKIYEELGSFKDSEDQINNSSYLEAKYLMDSGKYDEAINVFNENRYYKDSKELIIKCNELKAEEFIKDKKFDEAFAIYSELNNSEDAEKDYSEQIKECMYQYILANQNAKDKTTYLYLTDLISNNYKSEELKKVYNKLYKVSSVKVSVFDTSRRIMTIYDEYAVDDLGFNIEIKSNHPGNQLPVEIKHYTKESSSSSWEINEDLSKVGYANRSDSSHFSTSIYYGTAYDYSYAYKVVTYDSISGKKLAEKEFKASDIKKK